MPVLVLSPVMSRYCCAPCTDSSRDTAASLQQICTAAFANTPGTQLRMTCRTAAQTHNNGLNISACLAASGRGVSAARPPRLKHPQPHSAGKLQHRVTAAQCVASPAAEQAHRYQPHSTPAAQASRSPSALTRSTPIQTFASVHCVPPAGWLPEVPSAGWLLPALSEGCRPV